MPERVRSLALPQVSRRPVVGSGVGPRARHFHVDPELRHRGESVALQTSAARGVEFRRAQSELDRRLAPQQKSALPELIQKNLLPISAMVLVVGVLGLGITVYEQLRASGLFAGQSTYSTAGNADADTVKTDPMGAAVPSFAVALRHDGEFPGSSPAGCASNRRRTCVKPDRKRLQLLPAAARYGTDATACANYRSGEASSAQSASNRTAAGSASSAINTRTETADPRCARRTPDCEPRPARSIAVPGATTAGKPPCPDLRAALVAHH